MATQKQILANRASALRSTGPVSPEGKKIASHNSTRHGMLAQTVVLEGESRARFEELLTAYIDLIKPRSIGEAALVETMTIARWKQMRIWGIEKAGFQLEMSRETSAYGANATRGYLAFKRLADNSRVLDLTHRYETGYIREFCRAYTFLLKLREKSGAPIDDSLPKSGLELLQFSFATATWESTDEDQANVAPNEQVVEQADLPETSKTEPVAPPQPIPPHEPNSSKPATRKQPASLHTTIEKPREPGSRPAEIQN